MAIQGLRSSVDIIEEYHDRPESWRMGLLLNEPNGGAPLYALTSAMESFSIDDPHRHWFSEEYPELRLIMDAAINNTDVTTNISVVAGALLYKVGDLFEIEGSSMNEIVMVTTDPSSDTVLPVTRGAAGTSKAAVDPAVAGTNPYLLYIGSAYQEGSAAPDGRSWDGEETYNYTQIFRDTFELTGTMRETSMRTGASYKNDKRRCLLKHSAGIERALLFGKRSSSLVSGKPRRTMNGIIAQIHTDNIWDVPNGDLSFEWFLERMRRAFLWGPDQKIAYCGNLAAMGMNLMAVRNNGQFVWGPEVKEYGMNFTQFKTPFGDLLIKTHPQFNLMQGAADHSYTSRNSWMLILDQSELKYFYMKNRDTKYETGLEENGTDGIKDGYITECGVELHFPKNHALIRGITNGVGDA